jgi:peptide/nickel transport system permease protein
MSVAAEAVRGGTGAGVVRRLAGFAVEQKVGAAALAVIVAMALAALLAGFIAPFDPLAVDFAAMLSAPSAAHLLGTDPFGRDILSRLIYGARTALSIGFFSSIAGCSLGALIGVASAYFGGLFDLLVQRLVDIMLACPVIVLALVMVTVLGHRLVGQVDVNLIAAIAISIVPSATRVLRASALAIRHLSYIDAARASGYGDLRIIMRHMMPNIVAPYLIILTAYVGQAILLEASLSFIGLGVTEPQPAWGLMLSGDAFSFYRDAPWVILAPGLTISLAVFAFNLFGDALRDWLDPQFRN